MDLYPDPTAPLYPNSPAGATSHLGGRRRVAQQAADAAQLGAASLQRRGACGRGRCELVQQVHDSLVALRVLAVRCLLTVIGAQSWVMPAPPTLPLTRLMSVPSGKRAP